MKKTKIIIIVLIVIIIVLLLGIINTYRTSKENRVLYEMALDTLAFTYDENGSQKASIQVLEVENKNQLLMLQTKDSTIMWLKELVNDYKGKLQTALVIANSTSSQGGSETIIIYDTMFVDSSGVVFPTYTTSWSNQWEVGHIVANKDSIHRDIKISNKYEITLGKENNGIFKKRKYNVTVKNLNPNTLTSELRSFDLNPKPKRFCVSLNVGYGWNFSNNTFNPFLGIGVSYNLISIF